MTVENETKEKINPHLRHLLKIVLVGTLFGFLLVAGTEMIFANISESQRTIKSSGDFFYGLSLMVWIISILFPYSIFPFGAISNNTLLSISLFLLFSTYSIAAFMKYVWKQSDNPKFMSIVFSYLLGISVFSIYWILKGHISDAVIFFFIAPFTNLSIPLAFALTRHMNN